MPYQIGPEKTLFSTTGAATKNLSTVGLSNGDFAIDWSFSTSEILQANFAEVVSDTGQVVSPPILNDNDFSIAALSDASFGYAYPEYFQSGSSVLSNIDYEIVGPPYTSLVDEGQIYQFNLTGEISGVAVGYWNLNGPVVSSGVEAAISYYYYSTPTGPFAVEAQIGANLVQVAAPSKDILTSLPTQIVQLKDGNYIVEWYNDGAFPGPYFAEVSSAGTVLYTSPSPYSGSLFETSSASLAATADGNLAFAQSYQGQIYLSFLEPNFALLRENNVVSPASDNEGDGNPEIAALTNGDLVVVWTSGALTYGSYAVEIEGQILDSAGNKIGSSFFIAGLNGANPNTGLFDDGLSVAALDNNSFAVTWTERTGTNYSSNEIESKIFSVNAPTFSQNAGNNDEWILSYGQWAASAGPGSHPSGYNVAGIGDWTGSGTDGILWFDPSTGDTDEWQLSNAQWSASVDLGSHPGNFQISGTGDFFGNSNDDVLWTNTSGGSVQTDIWELNASGKWMASVSPGSHPAGYTVAGTGDWTGNGADGILWFNASTGDTDEWQLSNGKWAASVDLGSHAGTGWTIAGVGDFYAGSGIDDVLWTSVNGNGTISTDIWVLDSNGKWTSSISPGNHPAGYHVVAVGDFAGSGTSDILWQNTTTGDVDEWLINNGRWAGSVDLGSHPGNFQIAGVGDFTGNGISDILWHAPS